MNLQNLSLSVTSVNNYSQMNKNNGANNQRQNTTNALGASNSSFDKMLEGIQEQIKKIQESEYYDTDTKLGKIEELEKQLQEIEKAKAEQLAESMMVQKNKPEGNGENNNFNSESAVLDLSDNAKAIIEAENGLRNLKNASSTKVKLEGESNVLESEIKMDKDRGVNTDKKEEQLARLKEGVEKSFENVGEAVRDVNDTNDSNEIDEAKEINETNDGSQTTQ